MGEYIRSFLEMVDNVSDKIRDLRDPIYLVSSDDGDGLASAYLFSIILDELGKEYQIMIVDKVYPEFIDGIYNNCSSSIFLDLGGPFYKFMNEDLLPNTVIIDHHREAASIPSGLTYLNPLKLGFNEDSTPSTSVISYFIMKKIVDKHYRYAWAGLLGSGEVPREPSELAWRVLVEGIKTGVIRKKGKSYRGVVQGYEREFRSLYKDITLVSTMGYFNDFGLEILGWMRFGGMDELRRYVDKFKEERRNLFEKMFSLFESGEMVFEKNSIQWYEDVNKIFFNVSPRVFDAFSSTISMYGRFFNPRKYILGVENRNPYIPGYGDLEGEWLNISIRVTRKIEFRIGLGISQPVYALAEAAAFAVGGLGYGYKNLGSAVVPASRKDSFLNLFDELASGR